jgi:TolB-like protein
VPTVIVAGALGVVAWVWILQSNASSNTAPRVPPRLAVLVFQHSGLPELEPIALKVTDNLIASLGDVPGVIVPSMSAVLPYKDQRLTIDSLARALRATWVVDGRLYRVGDSTMALAQLTDAASGQLLESSSASNTRGNELKMIDDLVRRLSITLRQRVSDHATSQMGGISSVARTPFSPSPREPTRAGLSL